MVLAVWGQDVKLCCVVYNYFPNLTEQIIKFGNVCSVSHHQSVPTKVLTVVTMCEIKGTTPFAAPLLLFFGVVKALADG